MRNVLGLALFQATATHGDTLAAFGAGVGLGALSTARQTSAMAKTAIGSDILQTLDVADNLALQITFHLEFENGIADLLLLLRRQFIGLRIKIDLASLEDLSAQRPANAIDIGESDLDAFSLGKRDSSNACHVG